MKVHTQFLLSAMAPSHFPPAELPEIAFLGRSNVGKSSLLNSLVGSKIARTSNTPGRTQAINFFAIRWPGRPRPELVFADLPGYGYARVPRAVTRTWPQFIEPYLAERPTLLLCLCLVDANIPPQAADSQLIEFLRANNRPLLVVATKADRVGSRLQASLNALKRAHNVDVVLPYSSKTGQGQSELWKQLRGAVSQAPPAMSGEAPI
jgi:GTP-binding protein